MNRLFQLLVLLMLALPAIGTAQIKVAYSDPAADKDTATGVVIHSDPRLAVLLKKHKPVAANAGGGQHGGIRSGRGFRVQIYSGNDRNKATAMKIDFLRRFPGVRTYMTYISPQFRIKVGDFRSRAEAQKLYRELSTLYHPCMIVPDFIVVNSF